MFEAFAAAAVHQPAAPAQIVRVQVLTSCVAGTRVIDRQGKAWTVTNTSPDTCNLRNEAGETRTSLMWMLEKAGSGPGSAAKSAPAKAAPSPAPKASAPSPAPKASAGAVPAGAYQCYGGPAGNMKLTFRGPGVYANEQGNTGAYTMAGDRITFTTGPWAGFYGGLMENGKVGLTSRPNSTAYNMICEKK